MNKHLLSAALVAAFGLTGIANAAAADGKISFSGSISAQTCTIKGGTGTDGAATDFTVKLPTVATSALSAADKTAGETPFTVIIGGAGQTGCTDGKVSALHFEGLTSPVNSATGRLTNKATTDAATKVEVALLNKANAVINLSSGENADGSAESITGNTATLKYGARYHATGGASTAGQVSTYVNYSVVYR